MDFFSLLFFDTASRFYWLYLIGSLIFAVTLLKLQGRNPWLDLRALASIPLWSSRSSLVDLQWFSLNYVIKTLLFGPFLVSQYTVALWFNRLFYESFGAGNFFFWNELNVAITLTVTLFIIDDFSRFATHTLYHKVPFLWRFHAIHHSAAALTPLTFYRIHCVELFINSLRSVLVTGFVSGVFIYLFTARIGLVDILGVNLFIFCFNLLGANLRHSPVWLGYGRFEYFLISPAQHQIHHSAAESHIDKNMGSALAVWDYWFGSLLLSRNQTVEQFGVVGHSGEQRFIRHIRGIS